MVPSLIQPRQKIVLKRDKLKEILILLFFIFCFNLYGQEVDTVFILFDEKYKEMESIDFTAMVQAGASEQLEKSITYTIQQKEEVYPYSNKFKFSHFNQGKNTYAYFGGKPPILLKKPEIYLKGQRVLDIHFFRNTSYIKVCKTFEEEDSWKQDMVIFMVDVDEIKNDSIVMREVYFSRPVKE